MLKISLKTLAAHKRRLVGSFLAIFLGVAFLSGTIVLGDTLTSNFDRLFADANAGTDVIVRNDTEIPSGDLEAGRGLIAADLVDEVAAVDGVAWAEPAIEGYGQLTGADGEVIGGNGPPTLAGNWIENRDLNPYRLVEGRAPQAEDEVVINRGAAKTGDLRVGDTTVVRTPDPIEVTIVGLATFGTADGLGPTTFTAFTFDAAQRYLTTAPGQVSSILVQGYGLSQNELADRIGAVVPDGVEAITGEALTDENLDDLSADFLGFFNTFLLVFSGVALLVATFSIYNTFSIIVAQRTRESALLRAVGASRRQILASVLIETGIVGLVASVVGAAGGLGIAGLLKGLFDAFGFSLPAGGLAVEPTRIGMAVLIGLVVSLVTGMAPALKASRVPPLAALRDTAVDRAGASPRRAILGALVAALGIGMVAVAVVGGGEDALGPAGLGALATLVGVVIVGPVVARPTSGVIGAPIPRLRGVTGMLARLNAMRNPRRTSGTAAALMIGVSVVTLFTVFAASLRASVDDRVTESVTADLVVSGGQFGGGGLSPRLAADVAELPSVDTAVGIGTGGALFDGDGTDVTIADPAALSQLLDVDVTDGDLGGLGSDGVAVSRSVADDHDWALGDRVSITFADGVSEPFEIGAVYERADIAGDRILPRAAWTPHAVQDIDTLVFVGFADGIGAGEGRAAVEAVTAGYGGPDVFTGPEFAEETTSFISTALGIVYVMLGLAILIALMGIANTLSLSVHERTRELGLLRAVGQTRAQLRAMVRWESVIIATFGTVGGLGLGVFLGWALVRAAAGSDFVSTFAAPVGQLVVVLAVGAIAGVMAGFRPARRAARLDVLQALAAD